MEEFKKRHNKRLKMMKRRKMVRRIGSLIIILTVLVFIGMYKLPVFNVSQVFVDGNNKLTTEEIVGKSELAAGVNLFKLNTSQMEKKISELSYIDEVSVKRKIFPKASVVIEVAECELMACVRVTEGYAGIDKNMKVLEIVQSVPEGIIEFEGVKLVSYAVGEKLVTENEYGLDDMLTVFESINNFAYKDKISPISFEDTSNITFYYDNRLNIICGSIIDFDRKIELLEEVIQRDDIKENSRGTLDLRTVGRTIYTP